MSKVALTPDLIREHRDIVRRLDRLEAWMSGPRFFGPFTTGNVSVASGQQLTATWTHNLNISGTYGVIPRLHGSFPLPRFSVVSFAANTVTFGLDMTGISGTATVAIVGHVLE